MIASFEKECDILEKLCHPNIVNLIGTKIQDKSDKFGIIMEFCEGGTLKNLIMDPTIVYSMRTVVEWGIQLFDALSYLFNDHQIVHRDIKPGNILIKDVYENTLKLGDFGLGKIVEKTCTGTVVSTQRYMSPPQFDETQEIIDQSKHFQDSHRNDVYSLGLVIWEIIERKLVFIEYCFDDGGFNRDDFVADIILKKPDGLEPPNCQPEIKEIISRCTNFSRRLRLTAGEELLNLREILKTCTFIRGLEYLPRQEPSQKELVRPVGFNGEREWISLESSSNQSSESGAEDVTEVMVGNNENLIMKIVPNEPLKIGRSNPYIDVFKGVFAKLSKDQQEAFFKAVPKVRNEILEKNHSIDEWKEIFKKELRSKSENPEPLLAKVQKTLRSIYLSDFELQLRILNEIFFEQNLRRNGLMCPWASHYFTASHVADLENLKRKRFTTRFRFKCFVSSSTGDEWLLCQSFFIYMSNFFFKKDLSEFRSVSQFSLKTADPQVWMYTKDEDKKIFEKLRSYDEFRFSHDEPLDLFKIIEALRNRMKKFEAITKSTIASYIPIEEYQRNNLDKIRGSQLMTKSSIPGYLFQLRNPPRSICKHEPKCQLTNYYPEETRGNTGKWPEEMKILTYECLSWKERHYLTSHYIFFDLLLLEPLPLEKMRIVELVSLHFGRAGLSETICFVFLNCKIQKGNRLVMLLDHPNNYQKNEMIPCLTFDLKFQVFPVIEIQRYFRETPSTEITYTLLGGIIYWDYWHWDMSAQIFDQNGQLLFEIFAVRDRATWPQFLKTLYNKSDE